MLLCRYRACSKSVEWHLALGLLSTMAHAKLRESRCVNSSHISVIAAGSKGSEWHLALCLLSTMARTKVQRDIVCYTAGISACSIG
jgi:hypothetical protein